MKNTNLLSHEAELALNRSFARDNDLSPQFFSAAQLCKCCDISRTMLIKLEKEGILTPHHVNPQTGYRWYDLFGVARLQQYQMLRSMGLSLPEIRSYLGQGELSPEAILALMQERLRIMQNGVEAFALRLSKEKSLTFSRVSFPDVACLCRTETFDRPRDMVKVGFETHTQAVLRGYKLMSTLPMFSIRLSGQDYPCRAKICIPLEGGAEDYADEDVEVVPGGEMFSMLYYGGYEDAPGLDRAREAFFDRLQAERLTPTGPMRAYWIVSCYSGSQFRAEDYVFRLAVPI